MIDSQQQTASSNSSPIQTISAPLAACRTWLKILSITSWIIGIGLAITIIGLILAWLFIWMGVLLFQLANNAQNAHTYSDANALKNCFKQLKILAILWAILSIILLISNLPGVFFIDSLFNSFYHHIIFLI